ncbi:Kelch repeat-containing protein [Desulfurivibrio sp. D14AmB]|uniref:Kelch repeat-containing protein n=1 Tax=Desulfurivibrio sp. D14AmB TaxID=3374370 RepID=UPI00376EF294
MNRKIMLQMLILVSLFLLAGCSGGGSSGPVAVGDAPGDNPTDPPPTGGTEPPVYEGLAGFDFTLQEGDYWEYLWSSQRSANDDGVFRLTLGAPVILDGRTAFPVTVTGKPVGRAGDLTHIAVENNQVLTSIDGATFQVNFDAGDAGGQMGLLGYLGEADWYAAYATSTETVADGTSVYRLGAAVDNPLCQTIAGVTICGTEASYIEKYEYYKPGIGAVAYHSYESYTYTGGGYTSTHRFRTTINIVNSSLSAPDGFKPVSPWRWQAANPVAFSGYNSGATLLDGRIYMIGDDSKLYHYDLASRQWGEGAPPPEGCYTAVAQPYASRIYWFGGFTWGAEIYGAVCSFDPETGFWAQEDAFSFVGLGGHRTKQHGAALLPSGGVDRYAVFLANFDKNVYFYDFWEGEHALWSPSAYPGAESYRSLAVHDEKLYVFGGTPDSLNMVNYKIDPYQEMPTWIRLADTPLGSASGKPVVLDGKIYLILSQNQMYDPLTDSWTIQSAPFFEAQAAVAYDNKIYVVTSNSVLAYDPSAEP